MKSIRDLASIPAGASLLADEIVEFHAARILLLIGVCGTGKRIDGLTKLAKLDFFVRYPQFFDKACLVLNEQAKSVSSSIESSMVRHHYGPWDHRYYDILAFLRSRGLIEIIQMNNKAYQFRLTKSGEQAVQELKKEQSYKNLYDQMNEVKKVFGSKAGSSIKNTIYKIFEQEVTNKSLGERVLPSNAVEPGILSHPRGANPAPQWRSVC